MVGSLSAMFVVGLLAPVAFATGAQAATTRVVHPGESIQAAVNASAPGDTVVVAAGTYAQSVGIHVSGIKLVGQGAKLVPPADAKGMDCREGGAVGDGICIFGGDPGDPEAPVLDGVTVQGMTVVGFPDTGIFAINQTNLTYLRNTARDNDEYGMAAFQTVNTRMLHNTSTGGGEADFYLGDSPNANGLIRANVAHNGGFGVFVRDSEGVTVQDNDIRGNCAGILVLADNPGPAGNVTARHNTILSNTRACPADEGPALSGIGVALAGANDTNIQSNVISGNQPGGDTAFTGGVVLVSFGPTPPTNDVISKNTFNNNSSDVASDGTDVGTSVRLNHCGTTPGLCK
ncbi:MAG TPA: right-handed parallel beta-helix repeat-containing protein [Acidimicrobiia bacterium]|nr:right-handed parallel beta-helix repeat-containing protein [Acidimicrobiia bacterium]